MTNALTETGSIPPEIKKKCSKLFDAIALCNGNVEQALKMTKKTYRQYAAVLSMPCVKAYIAECRERVLDKAESCVASILEDPNADIRLKLDAAKAILQHMGRRRYGAETQVAQQIVVQSDDEKKVAIQNIFGIPE